MPARVEDLAEHTNGALCLPLPRLAESSVSTSYATITILNDPALFDACATHIAFTTRKGGVSKPPFTGLNLSYAQGDDHAAVDANRRIVCEALDAQEYAERLICPKQVHGIEVLEVQDIAKMKRQAQEGADGIVCAKSEVPVLLCFADCVPVILVAPNGAFAVLHAGWRGALGSISGIGLEKLAKATSCTTSEINCYIGPHIGACCYEVSSGLLKQFVAKYGEGCDAGVSHLNLSYAVIASLLGAGASMQRIVDACVCTSCSTDILFSHRAEHGLTGRHGAFAIRKE